MFNKLLIEGQSAGKFLVQLTRIADALEVLAGTYKTKDEEKTIKAQTLELLEDESAKVATEELEEKQELISKELEKNSGNFLWAEANIDSEELENIQ